MAGATLARFVFLLAKHGRLDGIDVVVDHIDIGCGRAVGCRERVGIKRSANFQAGFLGNLVHQPLVGDVFDEDRRGLVVLDLIHQLGDVGGRRFESVEIPSGARNSRP